MYYVHLNNADYGPYTEQQVQQLVQSGQMNASTWVWDISAKQQWFPASHFPRLFCAPRPGGAVMPNLGTSIKVTQGSMEKIVWRGRLSVWKLLDRFTKPSLLVLLLFALVIFVRQWVPHEWRAYLYLVLGGIVAVLLVWFSIELLLVKTTSWELTNQRLCWNEGLFGRTLENLELYRIKDIRLIRPFLMRLVGCGTIDYATSDVSEQKRHRPVGPIRKPDDFYGLFRKYVELDRALHGVKGVEHM